MDSLNTKPMYVSSKLEEVCLPSCSTYHTTIITSLLVCLTRLQSPCEQNYFRLTPIFLLLNRDTYDC